MRTPTLNLKDMPGYKDMPDYNVFVAAVSWEAVLFAQHRARDEWCRQM
jgi:hypothetical protein